MNLQPTQLNERITTIDIIRGFSLLGILLVNMFGFYLPQPHIQLNNWFTEAIDIIWHQNLNIYIQSSSYPLFSMLFGYGLAMQYMKAQRTGLNVYKFIPKRLALLFAIGMAHALFLWWGDIIATYAFCGFFLLLFLRYKSTILLVMGVVLNSSFHLFYIGILSLSGLLNKAVDEQPVDIQSVQDAVTAYATGGYVDAFIQRLSDLSLQMSPFMWIVALFTIWP